MSRLSNNMSAEQTDLQDHILMREARGRYRSRTVMSGGLSLILLIFIVITLISFAGISLSTARADVTLSEKFHAQTIGFLNARSEAQEYLAQLDQELKDGTFPADNGKAVTAAFEGSSLSDDRSKTKATRRSDGSTQTITKDFTVSDTQVLRLVLNLIPQDDNTLRYQVVSEQVVSTVSYEMDETLPVLKD